MATWNKGKSAGLAWLRAHVAHVGDECLIWPFCRMPNKGYGQVSYQGTVRKAHRVMCIMAHGEPPSPTHHAAHSCGRGHDGCVHPGHLSWKTPRENRLDSNLHGTGTGPKPRRLTFDLVQEIRGREGTQQQLADEYGVHPDTIGRIRRGDFWSGKTRSTLTREQITKLEQLRGTKSLAAVARDVGVKYSVASNYFRRNTFSALPPA